MASGCVASKYATSLCGLSASESAEERDPKFSFKARLVLSLVVLSLVVLSHVRFSEHFVFFIGYLDAVGQEKRRFGVITVNFRA
jgi:hypothetical protein